MKIDGRKPGDPDSDAEEDNTGTVNNDASDVADRSIMPEDAMPDDPPPGTTLGEVLGVKPEPPQPAPPPSPNKARERQRRRPVKKPAAKKKTAAKKAPAKKKKAAKKRK